MGKLGVLLGVMALVLGAYGAMELCAKDDQIEGLESSNGDLLGRVTALETRLADALKPTERATLLAADETMAPAGNAGTSAGLAGRAASPLDRLAALERTVLDQNKLIATMKENDAKADKARGAVRRFTNDRFYGSVDMAAKAMKLEEDQKADLKDERERAVKELKDLYALENDEGVTWDEVRKPKMSSAVTSGGGFTFAMPDMAKINKFKKGRIPGSSETFGEAEKRIRDDGFARMRNVLTPGQAKKWDKAHKDSLLRGGSGAVSTISFVGVGSDD